MFQKFDVKTNIQASYHLLRRHQLTIMLVVVFGGFVTFLLLFKLSTTPTLSLSPAEHQVAAVAPTWRTLWQDPLFLLNKLQLAAAFNLAGQSGATIARLPSVKLGALAIICLAVLIRAWHGTRIALFGCLLFACSAWTLHISRYASYDSAYLVALPMLLVGQLALYRAKASWVPYLVVISWGLLLYTPGMIWFILLASWWERDRFVASWQLQKAWWQRTILVLCSLAWLPVLVHAVVHNHTLGITWLGAPTHIGSWQTVVHRLAAVPLHLFVHGPAIPELWLGRLPLLDIFMLVTAALGAYFYGRHWRSNRSRLLSSYAIVATLVMSLGGPVSLSLIVPLVYLVAIAGLSCLLRDWLKHFPVNPVMRGIGVSLIALLVLASCAYNLQSYFVAWPHNAATIKAFTRHG